MLNELTDLRIQESNNDQNNCTDDGRGPVHCDGGAGGGWLIESARRVLIL